MAATALLMALHWVLAQTVARSSSASGAIEGNPVELARDGTARPAALVRHSASRHDLDEALRQSGVEHIAETRLLVLESSGKITVLKTEKGR